MGIRAGVFLVPVAVGCLTALCGCIAFHDRGAEDRLDICGWALVYGDGQKKPRGSDRDYFTLLTDMLDDPDPSMQWHVGLWISNSTVANGPCYSNVIDAYIDAGRDKELHERLRRAWREAKAADSESARQLARALTDLRMRQYLWAHPEVAEETGLNRNEPPRRGWYNLSGVDTVYISRRLLAAGDEEFREAWEDGDARLYKHWTEETLQAALRQRHAMRDLERSPGWTKATGPSSRPAKR